MSREWKSNIFGCFEDCSICLLAYVCPCYVFGTNAEHVGGNCVTCAVVSLIPVVNYFAAVHVRGRIRVQKGITGSCCNDSCSVLFCPFCVLVQSAKEVRDVPVGLFMARE